ncbi:glycosyltransferase family 4 protein [Spirosoma rhododendri]|uniref:Glycosyltransferase family 4 protein n=1 Tax=Spirosoma rhododendri TaxID=2728024 RepID=A0A7L5DHF0_9BACT|nr:glycosyltransferase family 1 protein [Spirosoma rhododendri]QJD77445.1 glycosyltransferase family 4 protein [Spirosoma rhododendri]
MRITYLFRSPGTGYSIETLFGTIRQAVGQQTGTGPDSVYLPRVSRSLRDVWHNLRFIRRQRFQGIVHITGDVQYAALALPASRTVLTIHDCIPLERFRHRPLRYALFWLIWYYLPIRRARVVTTISEKTRQDLLRYVGRVAEKVIVVPNAVDPAFLAQPADFNTINPIILQVGTASHKNIPRLLDALTGIPCTLRLVGPLTPDLRKRLQQNAIHYESYQNLDSTSILKIYTESDLVTFTSTYEGFGMPIVEANAVGRAVLTSAISPLRDVAGDAAHLVDPADTEAIQQGVSRLINDTAYRQQLIDAGYRNARRFSPEMIAVHYLTQYQRLIPYHR